MDLNSSYIDYIRYTKEELETLTIREMKKQLCNLKNKIDIRSIKLIYSGVMLRCDESRLKDVVREHLLSTFIEPLFIPIHPYNFHLHNQITDSKETSITIYLLALGMNESTPQRPKEKVLYLDVQSMFSAQEWLSKNSELKDQQHYKQIAKTVQIYQGNDLSSTCFTSLYTYTYTYATQLHLTIKPSKAYCLFHPLHIL